MTFDPTAGALSEMRSWERDPLSVFRYVNPVQRTMVENIGRAEIYLHASNQSGKTTGGAALGVALSRGLKTLAGVPLPQIDMPAAGALIVGSYKQSVGSSIAAYRKWIGSWPCQEAMVQGSMDYVGMFYVRPDGWRNDNPKTWSRIYVFTHDGEVPEGLRLDWWHADEIPPERMLRALRFRGKAGRAFLGYITGTPIDFSQWDYLMQPGEYQNCLNQIVNGKLRLQSSIYQNSCLSKEDLARAERAAATDPHGRARLFGEHVDITGDCPFDAMALDRLRRRCKPPERESVTINTKKGDGTDPVEIGLPISIWAPADGRDCYHLTADLASGIRAPGHDPLCIQIWARNARRLVLDYTGFVHPYGLGYLAGLLAPRYSTETGPCLVDPEANGGYIDQFMDGLHAAGYYAMLYDQKKLTSRTRNFGYTQNKATRDNIIASWQRALMNDDIVMEDETTVSCLANCIVDEDGFIQARKGYHDEKMICGGRALATIDERGERKPHKKEEPDEYRRLVQVLNDLGIQTPRPVSVGIGHRW